MAIILSVALIAACGCTGEKEQNGSADKVPQIKLGHVGQDHHAALYFMAENPEMFKKDIGIYLKEMKFRVMYELIENGRTLARIETIKVKGGSGMPAAMERGEIQIGFGGVAAEAFQIDRGAEARIIAPLQTEGDMLVMKPDCSATDWNSWVEWVKKRERPVLIGYKAPVAVAKLIFERALKAEGIKYGKKIGEGVKIVLVHTQGEKQTIPSLARGAVDGFVMNQPVPAVAVHKKLGKIICHLADLPPKGMWKEHPCCALYARKDLLKKHPEAIKAFLKLLLYATWKMGQVPELAVKSTSAWTKYSVEIESTSVPSITYLAVPTKEWLNGVKTWAKVMNEIGKFSKSLRGKKPGEIAREIVDFRLLKQAWDELRARKAIPEKPAFGTWQ
jgi:NitT/TauT family transport system substrate-binding protein